MHNALICPQYVGVMFEMNYGDIHIYILVYTVDNYRLEISKQVQNE